MASESSIINQLQRENADLRARLKEAEEILGAIRSGEVDALVVSTEHGEQVFTLKGADHSFRVLIEHMSEGALIMAEAGDILYANQCFADMLKRPLEKVMGSSILDWASPGDREALLSLLRPKENIRRSAGLDFVDREGNPVPTQLSLIYLQMDDGLGNFCVVVTDLTERKRTEAILEAKKLAQIKAEESARLQQQAEEERNHLQTIIDTIPVGFHTFDAKGKPTSSNEETKRIWAGEAPVKGISDYEKYKGFWPGTGKRLRSEDWPAAQAVLHGKKTKGFVVDIEKFDGMKGTVVLSCAPITSKSGDITGAVVAMQDITKVLKMEQELQESNRQLDVQLRAAELLQDLSTKMIQADDVEELYDQIINTAVTMLNSDSANIQLLQPSRGREGELYPLRHRGFSEAAARFWEWVSPLSQSASSRALKARKRVVVPNVQTCDFMMGSEDQKMYLQNGIQAVQATPLLSRSGKLLGMFSTHWRQPRELTESEMRSLDVLTRQAADLLERAQAEETLRESEERFRIMANSSPSMIWVHNIIGELQFINEAYANFFGVKAEDVGGDKWNALVHPVDADGYIGEFIAAFKEQREFHGKARVRRFDGEWRWIESYGKPRFTSSGEYLGISGTTMDITEKKKAEDALRESEERYRILSEQLQADDRRKDKFLGALSHEIRNPLASITLGLSVLERTAHDRSKAKQAREIMARQVAQLSHLVDDLLDVTRITRNLITLKIEQVELNGLVGRTVTDYQEMYREKGVELVVVPALTDLYVGADPTRLSQVLGNLFHNSLKFTKAGGCCRVTLSLDELHETAVIRVADNGIGMSGQMIKHLFEPFIQADESIDRSQGGLGLGLPLVKGLVELHGGKVAAYSKGLGEGSVVTIYLPLSAKPTPVKKDENSPKSQGQKMRVLVIEDIKDMAEMIKLLLEEDHEVMVANDGITGVKMAKEYRPDVVLCDIGLPGMDGYQVARALLADETLKDTILVSLTGYARSEDIQRSKEAGFHFQLAKPANLAEMRELFRKSKSE